MGHSPASASIDALMFFVFKHQIQFPASLDIDGKAINRFLFARVHNLHTLTSTMIQYDYICISYKIRYKFIGGVIVIT
jgi:hypothetical protein